jgi:hypothetical protein
MDRNTKKYGSAPNKKADAVSRTEPLTPPLLLELKWQAWNFSTYIIEAVLSVLGPVHLPPYRVSP